MSTYGLDPEAARAGPHDTPVSVGHPSYRRKGTCHPVKIEEDVTTAQDLITVRGHQLTIAILSSVTGRLYVVPD